MKSITKKFIHWLYGIIIAWILSATILYLGLYLFINYSTTGRNSFKQLVTQLLPPTIAIGNVSVGHYELEPVLKLQGVTIYNATHTAKLLHTHELQIGIDWIGSLLTWQFKPNLFLIRGGKIIGHQNKSGEINIAGITSLSEILDSNISIATTSRNKVRNFLEQSKIFLENIDINWQKADGTTLKFKNTNLRLYNDFLQRKLTINGKLLQPQKTAAVFTINLKFHGNIFQQSSSPLIGKIVIENWFPQLNFATSTKHNLLPFAGNIDLQIKNSQITTKLLHQPLTINNAYCNVAWQINKGGVTLHLEKLRFMDRWLTVLGGGKLLFPPQTPTPTVDIHLGFKLSNMAKANLYYPANLLPDDAIIWLDQAFITSKTLTGNMVLRGPLAKFPFDHGEGEFTVDTNLNDLYLQYDPSWPRIRNIKGKMVFTGRSLKVIAKSAKIMGEDTHLVTAIIPDLEFPILYIDGTMKNVTSSNGLQFINHSPLKKTIGSKLKGINLSGKMNLGLKLTMPLSDTTVIKKTQVDGSIELENNILHLAKQHWNIKNLSGNLYFDDTNFTSPKLTGKFFARPITFVINTHQTKDEDTTINIAIDGSTAVENFSKQLANYAHGIITYQALLTISNKNPKNILSLTSNLHDIELQLPPPFAKPISKTSPLNIKYQFNNDTPFASLTINYNKQISANLALKKNNSDGLTITGGNVLIGDTRPTRNTANSGLIIRGNLKHCNWQTWQNFLSKWQTHFGKQITAKIEQIKLKINELHAWQQILSDIAVAIKPHNHGWEVSLITKNIDGKIFFPEQAPDEIQAEFAKLHLHTKQTTFKPHNLPALNLKIADFQYINKKLQDVILITSPLATGIKINKFKFNDTKFRGEGSGEWTFTPTGSQTTIHGIINTQDCGELLQQWELSNSLKEGKGEINFNLSWPDTPHEPSLQTINGVFSFKIEKSKLVNLSKQTESKLIFNRILNLFSLQSLVRNFFFDLRHITNKGFEVNTLSGECEINNGIVTLNKLILDGSEAYVMAYGKLNIKKHAYNLMLSITPHFSVVPAAALLGGPIGIVAGFIVDDILTAVTKKQAHYNYHVTGTWENPVVTKLHSIGTGSRGRAT